MTDMTGRTDMPADPLGRTRRAMCAGMLGLQSVVVFLTTPVMLALDLAGTTAGLVIGLGLTVACLAGAATMRGKYGGWLGWAVQAASIALGFVVPMMFVLGVIFLLLYAGSWMLGAKIDRERAAREAGLPLD